MFCIEYSIDLGSKYTCFSVYQNAVCKRYNVIIFVVVVMENDSDCPSLLLEDDDEPLQRLTPRQNIRFSLWEMFRQHIPRLVITILVDAVLPFIVYLALYKHIRIVYALLAAGIPPLVMIVVKAIVSRTFDALGFLVFTGFAGSAIAAIITHNPLILLMEKSLVTGLTSLIFGITLIPFHCCHWRPLAYYFYQDLVPTKRIHVGLPDLIFEDDHEMISADPDEINFIRTLTPKEEVAQVYEWIYAHCSSFRTACYLITSIWTIGLLFEFLARLFLILIHLSANQIFIYGHIILSSITCLLIILTIICITRERKQTLNCIEQWKNEHFIYRYDPLPFDTDLVT